MYCIDSYQDLISEIEMSKARIEGFEKQRDILVSLMYTNAPGGVGGINYDGMPKGSRNYMSLDRIVERVEKIDSTLYIETSLLENMQNTKKQLEDKIKDLKGIKYKVAYRREIEGKTYKEIAADLNMSEDRIKHIGAEIKKLNNA